METHADCEKKSCSMLPVGCSDGGVRQSEERPTKMKGRGSRGKVLQMLAVVAANILSISYGTVLGWSTAVEPTLRSEFSEETASWIITANIPFSIVGCLMWGPITVRYGPRKSLLFISCPMIAGWTFLLKYTDLWFVLIGRALCGFSTGAMLVAIPVYVTDITEDTLRGRLGVIMSLGINLGILVTYSLGGFLDPVGVAIFCGALPVLFLVFFFPCPDSPLFLFNTGRKSIAVETLQRLRGSLEQVDTEITAFRASAKVVGTTEPRLGDLIRGKAACRAAIISLGVVSCQKASGTTPVIYYAGAIFLHAGGAMSPIAASCIIGVVQLFGSLVAAVLMDKAGRRPLMLLSYIVMALCQAALGYSMMPGNLAPSWTPVISLSVFIAAYSIGAGPVPLVIVSEVSAPRVKALACSVALSYSCVLSFVTTKTFPTLSNYLGDHGVFWLFGVGCGVGFVFCWFLLPETSGRSSDSIQAELEGRKDVGPMVGTK